MKINSARMQGFEFGQGNPVRRRPEGGGEGGEGGKMSLRDLVGRLKEADLDPRKEAQVAERIRNYIQQGNEGSNGGEFNARKLAKRIVDSDLSNEDKRALIGRVQNYVQGQQGDDESRREATVRDEVRSRRAAIDVA